MHCSKLSKFPSRTVFLIFPDFSLVAFNILSLLSIFNVLTILWRFLLWNCLVGVSCAFCICFGHLSLIWRKFSITLLKVQPLPLTYDSSSQSLEEVDLAVGEVGRSEEVTCVVVGRADPDRSPEFGGIQDKPVWAGALWVWDQNNNLAS